MKRFFYCLLLCASILFLAGCQDYNTMNNEEINWLAEDIAFTESDIFIEALPNIDNSIRDISQNSLKDFLFMVSSHIRHYSKQTDKQDSINNILQTLHKLGYSTEIQEFSIYKIDLYTNSMIQNPDHVLDINPMGTEILGIGENIVLAHPNNDNTKRNLYLTAHYDTTENTAGILDNASGCAILLGLAESLFHYDGELNLFFVFFDAEEESQQGARAFVREYIEEDSLHELGCINVDMVGEIGAGDVIMRFAMGEHNIFSAMWQIMIDQDLTVSQGVLTDEMVFFYNKIPAVTFENQYPDLSLDKLDRDRQLEHIDYGQMEKVANDILQFVIEFDDKLYNDLLNGQLKINSALTNEQVHDLNGVEYISKECSLVENGYIGETIVNYQYKNHNFSISMMSGRFFDTNMIDEYTLYRYPGTDDEIIFIDDSIDIWDFYYKVIRDNDNLIDIEYYNGIYTGKIQNITYDILPDILYTYQNAIINQRFF